MKKAGIIITALFFFMFQACETLKPLPGYLKNVKQAHLVPLNIKPPIYTIRKNDELFIQIYSAATLKEVDAPYNLPASLGGNNTAQANYLVDNNGRIEMPILGAITVEGFSTQELKEYIKAKLVAKPGDLVNPGVIVKLTGLSVTVIGEVKQPGKITIAGEKINILEAISQAGDITEYGVKDTVKISRFINNTVQTGIINLTDPELFQSQYFFLMPGDIVMVDQAIVKIKRETEQRNNAKIGFGLSLVSTLLVILSLFIK